MFTRRKQNAAVPEVGAEAPEFNLPSAQGGQLRLGMRTARGPVVVVFFRGTWSEEDIAYFETLSKKEDEINLSGASVVGIGAVEPDEAREFARASGIKSMVLYDYARITTRQWGLSERDKEHGEYARPAVFIVGTDHEVVHAWTDGRPSVDEIMAKITEITGMPKPEEEPEERPQEAAEGGEKPKKMSAEERERIKAERRAAREAGKSVKTAQSDEAAQSEQTAASAEAPEGEQAPKKMSKEERERIKAERRAAREAGKPLKKAAAEQEQAAADEAKAGEAPASSAEAPEGESEAAEEEPRDETKGG